MPTPSTIHDFFSAYSLSQARREMAQLLRAASSKQVWKGVPANLLFLQEQLQELMTAAFTLGHSWQKEQKAIVPPNWQHGLWSFNSPAIYYGWQQKASAWHCFPRYLSKKAFLNPYHAIQQFSNYANQATWTEILHAMVHHAFSQSAYHEYGYAIPLITAGEKLYQLVEACHLVSVRTMERETKQSTTDSETITSNPQQKAWLQIEDFFQVYGQKGVQEDLWLMLKMAMSNDQDDTPAADRSNLFFTYEQLNKLMEALWEGREKSRMLDTKC